MRIAVSGRSSISRYLDPMMILCVMRRMIFGAVTGETVITKKSPNGAKSHSNLLPKRSRTSRGRLSVSGVLMVLLIPVSESEALKSARLVPILADEDGGGAGIGNLFGYAKLVL